MCKYLKGLIFLWFILIFSGIGVHAQNTFRPEWAVGASGGVNFSSVSFRPKITQDKLIGYTGGLTARWLTEKNLGIQLEINLKQQGWSEVIEKTDEQAVNLFYIRKMNYVEIPLFTHIYFGGAKVRFFVNLGPQIGFFIQESTNQNLNGTKIPYRPNEQHTMPVERKFEWGLGGGPGLEFRSGIGYFLLEGRYHYSLSDFYSTRREDAFSKASYQIGAVKLTYLIPIRK